MLQIFVVFHKYIFDECYEMIPSDILSKYFTFIAVNNKIPKEYTPNKYNIINEWDLPVYDSTLQERGYNENSAIYHVYANNLHKPYSHVGFFQYDMKFNTNPMDLILESIADPSKYLCVMPFTYKECAWGEPITQQTIIEDYEAHFDTVFDTTQSYPMVNTYILPAARYEKIMPWIISLYDKLYPWAITAPNRTHFGHIAGIYERIMGYAIGNEKMTHVVLDIDHEHNNKFKTQSY